MATPKLKLKRPSYRGWTFVLLLGVVLAVVALIERGGVDEEPRSTASSDGSSGCVMTVQVSTRTLNTREGPSTDTAETGELLDGDRVDATLNTQGNFRQLEDGRWASSDYLVPDAGSTC